ncbi:Uma2 family endonuclease [Nodosilinea sp. LEGE 07088]|uniref:Uma2 family endonuclease n=1 Tax=Nodosilinea sp. LEGE 07088 TaxID=2777968 RepID=UPI0018825EC9|nr:Uma2 family endonuclease [Nodosilinea sp. LEGE 07088]MBE9138579.1 Uma2 family endonuclease [Nodosilinea sp. LEGE 07088]
MVLANDPNLLVPEPPTVPLPPCDLASDEPELESYLHLQQLLLLIKCLDWVWRDKTDYFAAGNLTIYYSADQVKTRDFKGPDFFVVLNAEKRPRKSWTVWAEGGRYPNLIVELLSDSTANHDRTLKKQLYQDTFRTPEYFWFSPDTLELEGFALVEGQYQPIVPNADGLLWSAQLNLHLGIHDSQLRYFFAPGQLVPTPEEFALEAQAAVQTAQAETQQARQQAEQAQAETQQARQQAEQAQAEAQKLAAKLRELGLDPDTL